MTITRQQRRAALRELDKEMDTKGVIEALQSETQALTLHGVTVTEVTDALLEYMEIIEDSGLDRSKFDTVVGIIHRLCDKLNQSQEDDEDDFGSRVLVESLEDVGLAHMTQHSGETTKQFLERLMNARVQQQVDEGAIALTMEEFTNLPESERGQVGRRYIITDMTL